MIKCREQHNIQCLKCEVVPNRIIRIGVIYMCLACFLEEFGDITEFAPHSAEGKTYYKWLAVYTLEGS